MEHSHSSTSERTILSYGVSDVTGECYYRLAAQANSRPGVVFIYAVIWQVRINIKANKYTQKVSDWKKNKIVRRFCTSCIFCLLH